jgi:hypothetical protein
VTAFHALTTTVEVVVDPDVERPDLIEAIVQSYPRAERGEIQYHIARDHVRRNDCVRVAAAPGDVVPLFEMDLYEQIVMHVEPGWLLHAAALDISGRALVLCGPSGAGKTTLTLALAARGYRILSEEIVWIGPSADVRGLPRPIHIPADSPQREQIPSEWTQLPYPIRNRDGIVQCNLLAVPPPSALQLEALPLLAIVRLGHGAPWPVHLKESPGHVALQRLWERSLRVDDDGLAVATSVLHHSTSYELSSTTEQEALELLVRLLK